MTRVDQGLEFREVRKAFGGTCVIGGIDLCVPAGEVTALIGPSGSGKTTLMRCAAGLETIDAGLILVNGAPVGDSRPASGRQRPIGMIFQKLNLFPHLSAIENIVQAPIHVARMKRVDARAEGLRLMTRMGLGDKAESYPSELSGGQQQRVAIARALAMRPAVLLFDEPTSALDPEMVSEVADVIAEVAKEGIAVLLVTHAMALVRKVAQRVAVIDAGSIIEEGPTDQVFVAPGHERTRRFLAAMALG